MRIVILIVSILGVVACTKHNPNVCCTTEADCMAQGLPTGSTCSQGLLCRGNQCIAETCGGAADCDPAAPYCVAQTCAEKCVDDTQCPGFMQVAADKYCVTGSCVSCRAANDCTTNAPVCDMGACRGCKAHADCASNVCDVDSGTCVAESTIAYAAPTGGMTSACTKADPCFIDRAFAVVDITRNTISFAPGSYDTTHATIEGGGFVLQGTFTVTMFGPATINTNIFLHNGTLRLRDLAFKKDAGLICRPMITGGAMPSLDLERMTLSGNQVLYGSACKMDVRRSTVRSTDAGATPITATGELAGAGGATFNRGSILTIDQTEIDGGEPGIALGNYSSLVMTNSVMRNQTSAFGSILFRQETTPSKVSFSTFFNTTLACPTGTEIFTLNNTIFLSNGTTDVVSGTSCTHTYDLLKPQAAMPVGTNNLLGLDPRFKNAAAGDFHLLMGSPAIDAADPTATLSVDFDGTARPQGARRDIGAFEYKP